MLEGSERVPDPLYQNVADFFRTLAHPVRIRVLELLGEGPRVVRDLLGEVGVGASNLSQQLAVLRRAGIVRKLPDGRYCLAGPDTLELMRVTRGLLAHFLAGQYELLEALREEAESMEDATSAAVAR
jgi:ArsR family transcriptional regulator, arsenate/arsenite/antimonite-responsive transcriptional repressor